MTVSLSPATREALVSLLNAEKNIAETQARISSGRRINSAADNASSFFISENLNARASQYNILVDAAGQSLQTIQVANQGLKALESLLEQAESFAVETLATESFSSSAPETINEQILASNPIAYWRLNETSGTTALNLGSIGTAVNGTYQAGTTQSAPPIFDNGGEVNTFFDGIGNGITIPDNSQINLSVEDERTIELVFQANTTTGRQVLYEEGATVNALAIYIDNGNLYINGRDQGDWGPFNISAPIDAGTTYHVALVLDQPNGELRGYVDGQLIGTGSVTSPLAAHSGDIGIGFSPDGSFYHDGADSTNPFRFNGQIAEVALYNAVISEPDLLSRASSLNDLGSDEANIFGDLINATGDIAFDASYRGLRLLLGDTLITSFDETGESILLTEGQDFTTVGLNLDTANISNATQTQLSLDAIRSALQRVREYNSTLGSQLKNISERSDFLSTLTDVFNTGSDRLTLADLNEESAKLLSLQVRQDLSLEALSLSGDSQESVLQLL